MTDIAAELPFAREQHQRLGKRQPAPVVSVGQRLHLHTVEAARKLIGAFFTIAKAWKLTAREQAVLLGVSRSTCYHWRNGQVCAGLGGDKLERLGYIMSVYAGLKILLPIPERAEAWIRQPNTATAAMWPSTRRYHCLSLHYLGSDNCFVVRKVSRPAEQI